MAAGAQATRQGWRWSYKTMGIFNAVFLVLFIFFYEETKYVPVLAGRESNTPMADEEHPASKDLDIKDPLQSESKIPAAAEPSSDHHELDLTIPMNPWTKRLALVTPTPESIWPYYYRPFIVLITFPAIMFTALQYAACVAWLTITASVLALVFPLPPYNFTPEQIGFMSLGPFIGNLIGSVYGGVLGDWSIKFFSRRNKGFYEPEMRLYILHLPALVMAGGLIMFGATTSRVSLHGIEQSFVLMWPFRECTGFILALLVRFSDSVWEVSVMLF